MTRLEIRGLYAITPDVADTASLVTMTQQVLAGGARLVQYRSKTGDTGLRLEQARSLAHLCAKFSVPLIINDYLDLACEVGADGVHLGRNDASLTEARRELGNGRIIGISCYNRLEYAAEAARHGADYVAFGAFFGSVTKPGAVSASLDLLRQAKRELRMPIVAIGGIAPDNAAALMQGGADALAASNALFNARNIRVAAERFSRLFKQNKRFIPHNDGLVNNVT